MSAGADAGVAVVRAGREDTPAVLALESTFPGDRIAPRNLRRLLAAPSAEVWLARVDGAVAAAMILLRRRNSRWLRIYSLAVDPCARGRGLARTLLAHAECRAGALGCRGLSLEVRQDNAAARQLYGSCGYVETGELASYYEDGADGVRLRKGLEPD